MMSFQHGLTYKAEILKDDRTGQKPTFLFCKHFRRSPPGGAAAFVYVLGFWPFWRSVHCDFPVFLVPLKSLDKNLQNIKFSGWNVFPNSFYSQNRISKIVTQGEFEIRPFFKVSAPIFFTFSGSIWILAQISTKIAKLQLGMCLLTHFMTKNVLRNEFTRSEFMVLGLFGGQRINIFHFFWSHSNPGTKIYKNSPTTAWNVPPNPFYAQKRTAKWVYEKRIHGFWPFWRLVKQYFPSVLVPFESLFAVWFWP